MEDKDLALAGFDSLDIMSPDEPMPVPLVKFSEKSPIRNPIMDSPIVQSKATPAADSPSQNIRMTSAQYKQISGEFRCPICTEILVEPVWLPCLHVFCKKCVKK